MSNPTELSVPDRPLSNKELNLIDGWWRAANYLSVGQIYLLDNPLLKDALAIEHIKPRLLGHWGTTPGLNFIYVHLNRIIKARDLDIIYIAGPGHGGPGIVANTWLEGTYSEIYPHVPQNALGMERLFKQFSFPGGISSHAAPETPGSIHEGGELGYSLSHAYGAAFDNPGLVVACVVGDGEAETGPVATSWHSNKFLNPITDGAVLPILHLNGYKIANPTVLARIPSAAAYRASSASPAISTGLARDQIGGSTASSRAMARGEMPASCPPRSVSRSTASTPMPPPLVNIASRLPAMLVKCPSVSAAANNSSRSRTRNSPARRNAAS
jgi:phosphoketolase